MKRTFLKACTRLSDEAVKRKDQSGLQIDQGQIPIQILHRK